MFPVRFKGKQIWPEEEVKAYAEAVLETLNEGESSGTPKSK